MEQKHKKKRLLSAATGLLFLAVSVGIAWFFPEWYVAWQDQRLLGTAVLSSREDISFLDWEALEMEECMKLLGETSQMKLIGYEISSYEEYDGIENYDSAENYDLLEEEKDQYYRIARKELENWIENGLIPEEYQDLFAEESYKEAQGIKIALSQKNLELKLLILGENMEYDSDVIWEHPSYSEKIMVLLLDAEKEMLYRAMIVGTAAEETMAQTLGYESRADMIEKLLAEENSKPQEKELTCDFAAVCRAKSARITKNPGELDFDVALEYDNFTGYAQQRIINIDGSFGLSVSLGTDLWPELMTQIFGEDYEWEYSTGSWQEYLLLEVAGVGMQELD